MIKLDKVGDIMTKVIIINANNEFINSTEDTSILINELLEKGFKFIIVNKEMQSKLIIKDNIPFKNLVNFIEINNTILECYPVTCMNYVHNYGINLNYPSTIIDCIEKAFSYDDDEFEYTYMAFNNNYLNRYTILLNNFFEKSGIVPRKITDVQSLEKELKNILNNSNDNFCRISNKSDVPEFPSYEEILFSDRVGTIEGYSLFFDKIAPFEENMDELVELLKNDKFLLCGVSSGDHQEGFLSKKILRKLHHSTISTDNILAFDQYHMARMIENNMVKQSNKIIMGFGDSTKEECVKQFLIFLEQQKRLPKEMYAIGDHPLTDIPMLKLIHSQGGLVGFVSPYKDKDKIIKAIGDVWLDYSWNDTKKVMYKYELELLREKQYYQMIQNIDENWDWIKPNIYDEAKDFLKKIRK